MRKAIVRQTNFVGCPKTNIELEEKISNLIHGQCSPVILPEIVFLKHDDKRIICTTIHKGSAPPYFLKNKGIEKGTFIRVGSSNRQASTEIIQELERQKQNISFDSELVFQKNVDEIDKKYLKGFNFFFVENILEVVDYALLRKKVSNFKKL